MTDQQKEMELTHRKEALEKSEKPAIKSKKFMAWLLFEIFMTAMAITALIKQPELGWPLASFMVGIVLMMGVATMWYLGKQAAVDSAIRGFAMVGNVAGVAGKALGKVIPPESGAASQPSNR